MATNYKYPVGCGVCLGVFHIIFGMGCCGCGIAAIVLYAYAASIAVGIWAGVAFYTMTGILALASASRNNCVITAYYIMALLSVFVSMGQMGVYIYAILYEVFACSNSPYSDKYYNCTQKQIQDMIMHGVLLLLAFLEWIIAMVSCCTACTCCCNNDVAPTQTVVIHTMQQPVGQPLPNYGGPAVAMPPPQAEYAGYSGGSFPASIPSQPAPGYSQKPQLPLASAPVYHNQTFDPNSPADENTALPHAPQSPEHGNNTREY
ncbi:uncharacterized protein LOC119724805 [Patiria miniata]|uniref:Uncharacterized protein n=1 Tax=Patiria miniata TaxID=46514 RepID=A0A913ZLM0_PATMI|nr:uncharacterized protein LOC119724805 [Patiria miniata]